MNDFDLNVYTYESWQAKKRRDNRQATFMGVITLIVMALVLWFVVTHSDGILEDRTLTSALLTRDGYTHVTFTGYRPLKAIGYGDHARSTGFRAVNRQGVEVTGAVISNCWYMGPDILLDYP